MRERQIDLLIEDINNRPIAMIEVKNWRSFNDPKFIEFAVELLPQMLEDAVPFNGHVPYLLLVSQDIGFLWKNAKEENPNALPDLVFPMTNTVKRYLPEVEPGTRLRQAQLEIMVLRWLTDLTTLPQGATEEPEKTLAQTGFIEAIQNTIVLPGVKINARLR